jgi:hypothetical protein
MSGFVYLGLTNKPIRKPLLPLIYIEALICKKRIYIEALIYIEGTGPIAGPWQSRYGRTLQR